MHIKIILLSILTNLSVFICVAQLPSQTIKGRVIDAESGQPISNVNVIIENLNTTTDEQGFFKIEKVLVGRHSVKFSRVGYENAFIKEILVGSGKEIVLDIKMTEQIKNLEEVVVKPQKEYGSPNNDMAVISVRSFSVEQTKRYPATWSDPARMALSFAGTSNVNDSSNEIVIRGNSPKGLLWRMNGIEIPSPNHFTSIGAAGGGISALSINMLSNSDFYTGAFPAEYGNAASGVFDLTMRNGNNTKWENSIQLGFQGLEVSTEGPFSTKSKASYLFNYRYSTLGLIQKMGLLNLYDDKPNYQDLAFKIYLPFKKTTFSLWGLGGLSINENANFPDYLPKNGSNFYATGLNIVSLINDKAYWENIISASGSETNNNNSSGVVRNYTYGFLRYSSMFNLKVNAQNTLRFGMVLTNNSYDLSDKRTFMVDKKTVTNTILSEKDNTQLLQSYFQWKYRINPKLTLNTGVHFMHLTLNKQSSVEPRLGLRFQVDNKRIINFGAGLHSRLEALPTYLSSRGFTVSSNGDTTLIQSNKNLPIPKSAHVVFGYETRPNSNWRINTEAYYQRQSQAFVSAQSPLSSFPSFESTYSSLNELAANLTSALMGTGRGETYGIELTIEKFLTNGFYLLNTTSLYKATYVDVSGTERRGRFSSDFVENIMAGKEWKVGKAQKNIFNINLKVAWAGGLRVIPIDLPKSIKANTTIYDYSRIYEERFNNFFRTDFRISYVINKNKKSSTFSLDLNNVTNQQNPLNHSYSQSLKGIAYSYQLGMIPIFNYRLEF
jgi:hypothetical protein